MSVSAFPYGGAAGGAEVPTVSAVANGDINSISSAISSSCSSGARWHTDGNEYETNYTGSYSTNIGVWLDSGSASQVWVVFTRSSGLTNFDGLVSGTRYQISSIRTYNLLQSGVGSKTISGYFQFYDAASAGNLLDRAPDAGNSTWTATVNFDPCPICCFTPETPILMANGMLMPIGKIREGDMIMTLRGPEAVTEVITRVNRMMYRITFVDGTYLDASEDHPFDVLGEPKSVNPLIEYKDIGLPEQLQVGDAVTNEKGESVLIKDITKINYPGTVYTLGNTLWFAKGMLVY